MSKMSPDKGRQVRDLFDAALARPPTERARFLDLACAGDEALRREVESLLAADQEAESFMETPAVAGAAQSLLGVTARLATPANQSLQDHALDGRRRDGEVYLAQDISLGPTSPASA
jgi:serine/threonine-protein kinase